MIDIKYIESIGGDEKSLRAKFEDPKKSAKLASLIDMNASRIQEGIQRCLENARYYWAIDQAYDVSQQQITYTLVRGLLSSTSSQEDVLNAVKSWGLSSMLTPYVDPTTKTLEPVVNSQPTTKLDLPTFFNIFVPVVAAYTKARWAKLFNDIDLYPFYKYEPLRPSKKDRLKCEIITSRIQRMVTEMGIRNIERQTILQALKYGVCVNFPEEHYYTQKQKFKTEGKVEDVVIREGVRFNVPHPSRVFYDLNQPLASMNTDTGTSFAGFWDIYRYRELLHGNYWINKQELQYKDGSMLWVFGDAYKIFSTLFPCQIKFPNFQGSTGSGDTDRKKQAFKYTTNTMDDGVALASLFCRIIPKDYDLFDYDEPVWFRFIMANEREVVHVKPYAYNPLVTMLYDADANSYRPAGLSYELIPFQDHLGNLLTQYLLSVKRNLTNITFYNSDGLDSETIDKVQNLGKKQYTDINLVGVSGQDMKFAAIGEGGMPLVQPVTFPQANTSEMLTAVNTLLNVMERMLGFSPQELGAPASHEQSATEVSIASANTSIRNEFTGGFRDDAIRARKQLLYDALMSYGSDEVFAEIVDMTEIKESELKAMGFKVERDDETAKAGVIGDKNAIKLDGFASDREGVQRSSDSKMAAQLMQMLQSLFSNQVLMQLIGVEGITQWVNTILEYAGVPKELKMRIPEKTGPSPEEQKAAEEEQAKQQEAVVQQIQQIAANVSGQQIQQLIESLKGEVIDPMQAQAAQLAQGVQGLGAAMEQSAGQNQVRDQIIARLGQAVESIMAPPQPGPPSGQITQQLINEPQMQQGFPTV